MPFRAVYRKIICQSRRIFLYLLACLISFRFFVVYYIGCDSIPDYAIYICLQKNWMPVIFTDRLLQYDGSNDDLDCRTDFRYLNFVCIIKYLRSRVIKVKMFASSNFNLRLDLIKISFFKVITNLNR